MVGKDFDSEAKAEDPGRQMAVFVLRVLNEKMNWS